MELKQIFTKKRVFPKNLIPIVLVFILSDFIFRYVFKLESCRYYAPLGNPFNIGVGDRITSCEPNNLFIVLYAVVLTLLIVSIYRKVESKMHD